MTKKTDRPALFYYLVSDGDSDSLGTVTACCEEHARDHAEALGVTFVGLNEVDCDPELRDAPDGCDLCGWEFEESDEDDLSDEEEV